MFEDDPTRDQVTEILRRATEGDRLIEERPFVVPASYDAIVRARVGERPGRVLELGAGTGQIAVRLARRG